MVELLKSRYTSIRCRRGKINTIPGKEASEGKSVKGFGWERFLVEYNLFFAYNRHER